MPAVHSLVLPAPLPHAGDAESALGPLGIHAALRTDSAVPHPYAISGVLRLVPDLPLLYAVLSVP